MQTKDLPIGVLDSGVGGIAVLRLARAELPCEDFIFYADMAHAPYGDKPRDTIIELTLEAALKLQQAGVKALVVACNTATAAAISALRESCPFPVIGMEPALKPASEGMPGRRVAVMATAATLQLDKFHDLAQSLNNSAVIDPVPCPGLVERIETHGPGSTAVQEYLRGLFANRPRPDAVVIGCTHYSFIKADILELFPGVALYDGARGTVRHLAGLLAAQGLLSGRSQPGNLRFLADSDHFLSRMEDFYTMPLSVV